MPETYTSPFADRYSSKEMLYNFSANKKFKTWRKLWLALAEAEQQLGLPITDDQIQELYQNIDNINYEAANNYEAKFHHDVMAHIHAYGDQCPTARKIIHLGATSAYVVDNTDLILLADGYQIIESELLNVIDVLTAFAQRYAAIPTVAFTHFQAAQFTTVGKRACLWLNDLLLDLDELRERRKALKFLGVKGATGTQASFLELFNGDETKVRQLDEIVTTAMGFRDSYIVSGQTYSRKIDAQAQATLAGIAQSAHKFANDVRLLQHLQEITEPFSKDQVGSSAMAYKHNPMKCERITSLSRLVLSLWTNSAFTAASQWFERTLDDSAGKRIALPEAFLATDAILRLMYTVISGLAVNEIIIGERVAEELPSIITENLLMKAVMAGGDRQELHERIRKYSLNSKNLLETLAADDVFGPLLQTISLDPMHYTGRAASQVNEFIGSNIQSKCVADSSLLCKICNLCIAHCGCNSK